MPRNPLHDEWASRLWRATSRMTTGSICTRAAIHIVGKVRPLVATGGVHSNLPIIAFRKQLLGGLSAFPDVTSRRAVLMTDSLRGFDAAGAPYPADHHERIALHDLNNKSLGDYSTSPRAPASSSRSMPGRPLCSPLVRPYTPVELLNAVQVPKLLLGSCHQPVLRSQPPASRYGTCAGSGPSAGRSCSGTPASWHEAYLPTPLHLAAEVTV